MTPAQIDCARRRVVENFLQGHKIWSIKTRVSTGLLWLHHTYCIQYPYSLHLESTKTVIRIWFREFLELLFQNDQSVLIIFYAKYVPCTFRDIWWDHNVKTGSPIWNHFMANTKYYFFNQCSCDYKIKKKKKSNYASLVYWPFRIFHNFSFLSLDMKAGHPAEPSPEGFSCQTDTHTHDAAIVHIPSRTT